MFSNMLHRVGSNCSADFFCIHRVSSSHVKYASPSPFQEARRPLHRSAALLMYLDIFISSLSQDCRMGVTDNCSRSMHSNCLNMWISSPSFLSHFISFICRVHSLIITTAHAAANGGIIVSAQGISNVYFQPW